LWCLQQVVIVVNGTHGAVQLQWSTLRALAAEVGLEKRRQSEETLNWHRIILN